jgi:GntR family transcriptional regulator
MIDRESGVPPYQAMAADLRARIGRGEITGRLPTELELQQAYGLSHGTVRKALKLLRDEGLITTSPGWGSYVAGQ